MTKLFIPFITLPRLGACSKSLTTPTTTVTNSSADTVVIMDNGTSFTYVHATNQPVQCSIRKTVFNSVFSLVLNANAKVFLTVFIRSACGPANSLGSYIVDPVDGTSFSVNSKNKFTETFSGGEAYTVDSVLVNINTATGKTIIGGFQMWVENIHGSKKVTGTLNCHNANIN